MASGVRGKKFINSPENCVAESLYGFIRTHPHLRLLKGFNTVIREDVDALIAGKKVCIVTGGGSGHEPSHIGYIGKGLLTASVCGDVFASPPASTIYAAILECASPGGVLLVVTNYTGDRLNFGKAAELAKHNGIKVDMVIVGEDCALTGSDKSAGRRGLCGTMFVHKVAGAMAENGCSLEEIKTVTTELAQNMATISISLSPCSVPGQAATFQVAQDEAEFGLGIHGEPGVKKIKMTSARNLVGEMIEYMGDSKYIKQLSDSRVAVFVNSLGGSSQLELSLMAGEVLKNLESRGTIVSRCYVGLLMTSLEMAGISVTVLHVDDNILQLLDQETHAPAWLQGKIGGADDLLRTPRAASAPPKELLVDQKNTLTKVGSLLFRCSSQSCNTLIENQDLLNAYDRNAGDGDCGTTFARGATALKTQLGSIDEPKMPLNNADQFFLAIASIAESSMGGSSGALLSLFFTAASVAMKDGLTARSLISALRIGSDAISRYGGAEEGDRTMLDTLFPLLRALEEALHNSISDASALAKVAQQSALEGAKNTISMTARAGRASYISSSQFTDPDPGATAVALVVDSIAKILESGN